MKRFAKVALLAAMMFGFVASASAGTELKVKGSLDVYGMWSNNLTDLNSENSDPDNYSTWQRLRTYFTFQTNENLKAVLGVETNNIWGHSSADSLGGAGFGTDGTTTMRVKHAYLDFTIPDTVVEITAGLQALSFPSIFGSPIFDDDAAAFVVSAPINDVFGLTVGYSRGADSYTNYSTGESVNNDNTDVFFVIAPVKLNGFAVTPYAGYVSFGEDATNNPFPNFTKAWAVGANAKLTMFDPFTVAADLIYASAKDSEDDLSTKGWYGALAASYKFDMLTATLFGTYATGHKDADDADHDGLMPSVSEGWALTPYLGGASAFNGYTTDGFFTDRFAGGTGDAGTGLWSVGVQLSGIHFVDKLSHDLTIAYARGTSTEDSLVAFDKNVSAWEVYMVNKYMIFENLAAINELGYFAPHLHDDTKIDDVDSSAYMTIGLQYKF